MSNQNYNSDEDTSSSDVEQEVPEGPKEGPKDMVELGVNIFGWIFGRDNNKEVKEGSGGGNPENPNRSRESSSKERINYKETAHLDENFLTYLANQTNDKDYLDFEKCRENPAWFRPWSIQKIMNEYYRNKVN